MTDRRRTEDKQVALTNEDLNVAIASMREQIIGIAGNVADIRTSMTQLLSLERVVAKQESDISYAKDSLAKIHGRFDAVSQWQVTHEAWATTIVERINASINTGDKANDLRVETIDKATNLRVDAVVEFQNKVKGALTLISVIIGVALTTGFIVADRLIGRVADGATINAIQDQRITQIERLLTVQSVVKEK